MTSQAQKHIEFTASSIELIATHHWAQSEAVNISLEMQMCQLKIRTDTARSAACYLPVFGFQCIRLAQGYSHQHNNASHKRRTQETIRKQSDTKIKMCCQRASLFRWTSISLTLTPFTCWCHGVVTIVVTIRLHLLEGKNNSIMT